jgi:hypothetical protein
MKTRSLALQNLAGTSRIYELTFRPPAKPIAKPQTLVDRARVLDNHVAVLAARVKQLSAAGVGNVTNTQPAVDPDVARLSAGLQQLGYSTTDAQRMAATAVAKMNGGAR